MKRTLILLAVLAALSGLSYAAKAAIEDWSTTAGSNNSASPDGFPEGMAPSGVNNAARELMAQVRRWAEQGVSGQYATESGTTTAYAMTPDIQPTAYTTGALYWFVASTTNTGPSTLDINSLGTKNIHLSNQALRGGEIVINRPIQVVYDGTQFEIVQSPPWVCDITNGCGSHTPASTEDLFVFSSNGADTISILSGTDLNSGITLGDETDEKALQLTVNNAGAGEGLAHAFFSLSNTGGPLYLRDQNANSTSVASALIGDGFAIPATPDGTLHVHTASAGSVTANGGSDDLVVENSASGGISILTPDANSGILTFGAPSDDNYLDIYAEYDSGLPDFTFRTNGSARARLSLNEGGGYTQMFLGGDLTNANMTAGLTIDQAINDNEILALKSSDVAHGVTDVAETDTYTALGKNSPTLGGLKLEAFAETGVNSAVVVRPTVTDETTTKSTAASGPFIIDARKKSGTDYNGTFGANSNIVVLQRNGTTMLLVDEDGDIHSTSGAAPVAFDDHDDIALLSGFRGSMMPPEQAEKYDLAKFIDYARPVLEKHGIVTYNDDGHHFVSYKGIMALLIDAVRQQAAKQANEIDVLRAEIRALRRDVTNDNDNLVSWPGAPLATMR